MRITHEIDVTTTAIYNPSMETLMLAGENQRLLRAECLVWDKSEVPKLTKLCLLTIAENFPKLQHYMEVPCWDRDHLLELLAEDLELDLVVPLIENNYYWERRFLKHYPKSTYERHNGWTWKCIYLEHHIQKLCEEAEPQYGDEHTFESILDLCAPYIHILTINKLQYWKHPLNTLPEERPEIVPNHHINFIPVLKRLPYLVEFNLSYKIDKCEKFELRFLKISLEDCHHLTEALGYLEDLKTFRLINSAIDCSHIKALIRQWTNTSIETFDLSHCKIGDVGAKCIALLSTTHENLKVLNLRNNKIGAEGAMGLAWALTSEEHTNLECLDLSLNPLGSEGVMVMFRCLVRSSVLRELNMSNCQVKLEQAIYPGAMFKVNNTLEVLDISNNPLNPDEGTVILEALQNNFAVLNLNLRFTGIPLDIQTKIKTILKRNLEQTSSKSEVEISESISYTSSDANKGPNLDPNGDRNGDRHSYPTDNPNGNPNGDSTGDPTGDSYGDPTSDIIL